jgi:hypothetical protein
MRQKAEGFNFTVVSHLREAVSTHSIKLLNFFVVAYVLDRFFAKEHECTTRWKSNRAISGTIPPLLFCG